MLYSVAFCLIGRMRFWPSYCPAGQAGSARVLCVHDKAAPGDAVWLAADVINTEDVAGMAGNGILCTHMPRATFKCKHCRTG